MHARLQNEFTEDEKCHNLMKWLISAFVVIGDLAFYHGIFETRHEKTCLRGLRLGKTQTGLLSYTE